VAEDVKGDEPEKQADDSLWTVLVPVLSFIGTGIGILGFVIFFGGFVTWIRFDAAGLPANEAVGRIPRNDLVTTGASFLVPALLAALAAVALAVVLWDAAIGNRRRRRAADLERQRKHADSDLERLRGRTARLEREIKDSRQATQRHEDEAKAAARGSEARAEAREKSDLAEGRYLQAEQHLVQLQEEEVPAALRQAAEAEAALAGPPRSNRTEKLMIVAVGGIPMVLAQGLVIALALDSLRFFEVMVLGVVAVLTLGLAIAVVSMTNFGWYTACVFVGVGILIATSLYLRTDRSPKVSPVAALDGSEPVTGFFVAETDDSIYVAHPVPFERAPLELDHDAVAMTRLSKDTVSFLTVGPLKREAAAYQRSMELALALCDRLRARAKVTVAASRRAARAAKSTAGTKGGREGPKPAKCADQATSELRTTLASFTPGAPQVR
jgi:hypothetical protein